VHPSQTELVAQLRHFPRADHDDGPDALHMLWVAATSGLGAAPSVKARARAPLPGALERAHAVDLSGY